MFTTLKAHASTRNWRHVIVIRRVTHRTPPSPQISRIVPCGVSKLYRKLNENPFIVFMIILPVTNSPTKIAKISSCIKVDEEHPEILWECFFNLVRPILNISWKFVYMYFALLLTDRQAGGQKYWQANRRAHRNTNTKYTTKPRMIT